MNVARRRAAWSAAGAAVPLAAAVIDYTRTGSPADATRTLVSATVAVLAAALAASLPGITVRGAVAGALFSAAGIFTWTFTDRPIVIWLVLAAAGVIFAAWARPWLGGLRGLALLPRLGGAWLGLPYWLSGIASAVLVRHPTVAVQRVAYAGVFTLAALAVVASARPAVRAPGAASADLTPGIAAAVIVAVAALLLAGSGSMLDAVHATPHAGAAHLMRNRFWGGLGLFFQPNSLAGLMVFAALRIAPDRAFAAWQRTGVTVLACFVLFLTNSRSAFGVALVASAVHAVLVWRGRRADLPAYRRRTLAVLTPFVLLALVFALSGGTGFILQSRFSDASNATGSDVTSGRGATLRQVLRDWERAGWAEKAFGDARTSRAVVFRTDPGAPAGTPPTQLNTDDAAFGALRRGGVAGLVAFLAGVVLLLRRALRRRGTGDAPAAWFTVAAIAAMGTVGFEDWLLGGTNGVIWCLLLAGEAYELWGARPGPAGFAAAQERDPEQPRRLRQGVQSGRSG